MRKPIPTHIQQAVPSIRFQNRLLEKPLSLLYVNASDIERLSAWQPWLRRIVLYGHDKETHYRLVATAMGLDFYTRFNLRLMPVRWYSVANQMVAWPFDIIYICLDETLWNEGLGQPQGWISLLSTQAAVSEEFLLITEGPREMVGSIRTLVTEAGPIGGGPLNMEPLVSNRYTSHDGERGFRIWKVSHEPSRKAKQWTREELDAVTDLMQWGEDDS